MSSVTATPQSRITVAVIILFLSVLIGCSNGADEDADESATSTPTSTSEPCAIASADEPAQAQGPSTGLSGGAYGFYTNLSLFAGPKVPNGPAPEVTLPEGGSAIPVTASEPTSRAQYGPAVIFSSNKLEVSTQGTGGSVTSSTCVQNINTSMSEVFTADYASSTCTADASGARGSTKMEGGKLTVSLGPDLDETVNDDTVVDVPVDPEPNTAIEGKIENVGDSFRYVFNEQIVEADGSITVNAGHLYLLGPIAVGDLIFGQSRCSTTAAAAGGGG